MKNEYVFLKEWKKEQTRLLMLIEVASIKNQPPKKMGKREAAQERAALNAARRAKYHTTG